MARIEALIKGHKGISAPVRKLLLNALGQAKFTVKRKEQEHISEIQLYRNLATLGISVGVFGHETESVIYCIKNDCQIALLQLSGKKISPEVIKSYIRKIEKGADDLQSYSNLNTEYLRKKKRSKSEISVKKVLGQVLDSYKY